MRFSPMMMKRIILMVAFYNVLYEPVSDNRGYLRIFDGISDRNLYC